MILSQEKIIILNDKSNQVFVFVFLMIHLKIFYLQTFILYTRIKKLKKIKIFFFNYIK